MERLHDFIERMSASRPYALCGIHAVRNAFDAAMSNLARIEMRVLPASTGSEASWDVVVDYAGKLTNEPLLYGSANAEFEDGTRFGFAFETNQDGEASVFTAKVLPGTFGNALANDLADAARGGERFRDVPGSLAVLAAMLDWSDREIYVGPLPDRREADLQVNGTLVGGYVAAFSQGGAADKLAIVRPTALATGVLATLPCVVWSEGQENLFNDPSLNADRYHAIVSRKASKEDVEKYIDTLLGYLGADPSSTVGKRMLAAVEEARGLGIADVAAFAQNTKGD